MDQPMWMVIVTARAEPMGFLLVCAALAGAAATLRLSSQRRWFDSVSTFILLTALLAVIFYLSAHVLAEISVAGIEFFAWRE
jgi:uncharacterized membrane protein YjjP (DUF1212 family)